ncbi:MAG: hypothetical protein RL154_1148 [Pseudomonadota bacterium]|jgi:hypothetical protein
MINNTTNNIDFKDYITALILTILTTIYLLYFMGFGLENVFGDLGDGRFNNYVLEHGYRFIIGEHISFWNAPFFYPAQNVTAYSDNHLGTLPFYALFRFLNYDIETSYQLWAIVIFILNIVSAYFVLRLFKFNIVGSAYGAFLFTFCAPMLWQIGHIQLAPRFMVPIIFYALAKYIETLELKYFYIFCASFVGQLYIGIYVGFFALMGLVCIAPFVAYYLYRKNKAEKFYFSKKYFIGVVLGGVGSIILLIILFYHYILLKSQTGGHTFGEIITMLPRVESWLFAKNYKLLPYLNSIGDNLPNKWEHVMFIGIVPVCALFASSFLIYKTNRLNFQKIVVAISIAMIVMIFIETLVIFDKYTLYRTLLYWIPGLDSIRAVSRVILFLVFPFAILSAFVITYIANLSKLNYVFRTVIIAVIVLFGVFEQVRFLGEVGTTTKIESQARYKPLVKILEQNKSFDILLLTYDKPCDGFEKNEIDSMFTAMILNRPTINGYSGNTPFNYYLRDDNAKYADWLALYKDNFHNKTVAILDINQSTLNFITTE